MPKWTEVGELASSLQGWTSRPGPLYRRLAEALGGAIERGDLAPGARLAPERPLAENLEVSRTTVVLAYDQLRRAGLVESRQGSGTFVTRRAARSPRRRGRGGPETVASVLVDTVSRATAEEPADTISLMGACLPAAEGVIQDAWEEARGDVAAQTEGAGYSPQGLLALRQGIAAWYQRRGLPTHPDEVLVTSGAQQAIDLATRLLVGEGDGVVMEDPTYIGAIDATTQVRARRRPVPVGALGADVDAIGRLVSEEGPALVYLVPTFHNPTGTVLPEGGRRELARLAEKTGTPVLEDESLVDLSFEIEPPSPIAAFAPQAPVLTVGSLSKLFWGGLRVGWIRGPRALIAQLTRLKVTADLSGSVVSQVLAARLLPRRDDVVRQRRLESRARFDHLSTLLRDRLPEWTFAPPEGGLTIWVRLPFPVADEVARVAPRHGVSIVPGPVHSVSGGCRDHLRIPFVLEPDVMTEAVARLARAWEACGQGEGRRLGVIV